MNEELAANFDAVPVITFNYTCYQKKQKKETYTYIYIYNELGNEKVTRKKCICVHQKR